MPKLAVKATVTFEIPVSFEVDTLFASDTETISEHAEDEAFKLFDNLSWPAPVIEILDIKEEPLPEED